MSTGDDFTDGSGIICLVLFLAIEEALAPIMLGRSIWSFRQLEYQNLSFISDSIDWAGCGKISSYNFGHNGSIGTTCK